jgi:hypothetical protein
MKDIADILSYDGSQLDISLNYIALVICSVPFIGIFHKLPLTRDRNRKYLWIPTFLGLSLFQVRLVLPEFVIYLLFCF